MFRSCVDFVENAVEEDWIRVEPGTPRILINIVVQINLKNEGAPAALL